LIKLKQPRLAAASEDKNMSFGILCHPYSFPEVNVRWKLQEIQHGIKGYLGHILAEKRTGNEQNRQAKL
jgi:hypothetical protein